MRSFLLASTVLSVGASAAYAQGYEWPLPEVQPVQVPEVHPVQKSLTCYDVVVTQQLQTLMLLTRQLAATSELGVTQVEILRNSADRGCAASYRGGEVSARYAVTAPLLVSACAATPTGPTVQVMPALGKPFYQFTDDDVVCRHYAGAQVRGEAEHANWMQAAVAGGGTILGAGLGAAIGGGKGAAIGAGAGALGGTAVSSIPSGKAQGTIQDRYDIAYGQCMYSRGNQVPGFSQHTRVRS